MTEIAFQKWEATGNDFLFVDSESQGVTADDIEAREVIRACDRSRGFGADGVIFYTSGRKLGASMTIVNSDGSRGDMCGNALRCLAKILHRQTGVEQHTVALSERSVKVLSKESGPTVAMGPVTAISGHDLLADSSELNQICGRPGYLASFGNPHYVIPVESLPPNWEELGAALQEPAHRLLGTGGINVGFLVTEESAGVRTLRVFERGAGATQSCGSGACAASAVLEQVCSIPAPHVLQLSGGELTIGRQGEGFTLSGPANLEYTETWRIEN